jgi:hypothetical protein
MIDTDKYEGHTEGPWTWFEYNEDGLDLVVDDDQFKETEVVSRTVMEEVKAPNTKGDALLIADAPLLLAEVERLRERLSMWESWFNQGADNKMQDGDVWDIVFHNHECPNGKDCDGGCWNCETKELIE